MCVKKTTNCMVTGKRMGVVTEERMGCYETRKNGCDDSERMEVVIVK